MNSINIDGRLTADCEIKTVGDSNVINFSIANDDERKKKNDGSNDYENVVSFFNVTYWSKSGKMAGHLLKGKMVSVSGKLKQDRWKNEKTGDNNSKVLIKAFEVKPFVYEKAGEGNQKVKPDANGNFQTGGEPTLGDDEVPF